MADYAMEEVERVCKAGLPRCYRSFKAFTADLYSDLPWDSPAFDRAVVHILRHHKATLKAVKRKFKFDMREDLVRSLEVE